MTNISSIPPGPDLVRSTSRQAAVYMYLLPAQQRKKSTARASFASAGSASAQKAGVKAAE